MEETPHEKRYLSGDSKPGSGVALVMFGLTIADYGDKETCSQIEHKYRPSFKSAHYKTRGMERKLTTLNFKVFSCSIVSII